MSNLYSFNYYNCSKFSFRNCKFIGKISSIHDGDTMNVIVEVYPGKFNQLTLRLYGINTPELYGDERPMGLESKYRLIEIFTGIPVDVLREMNYSDLRDIFNKDQSYICYVECMDEDDKYGRVLARVYRDNEHRYCVNDMLLSGGYAREMGAHNRRTIRACAAHHAVPEGYKGGQPTA